MEFTWQTVKLFVFVVIFITHDGKAETIFRGKHVTFSCPASSDPIWMMQSKHDFTMRGIAVGERKQTRFKDERFVDIGRFIKFEFLCNN